MALLLLANNPILPEKPIKTNSTPKTTRSNEEYSTPKTTRSNEEYSTPKTTRSNEEYSTPKTTRSNVEYSTPVMARSNEEYSTPKTTRSNVEYSTPVMARSNEEYSTPLTSHHTNKSSSDSESISTSDSSTEDTECEDYVNISKSKHVRFDSRSSKPEVRLKLENDEAEFFVDTSSVDSSPIRKRDRIRSAFRKKFCRSKDSSSDTDSTKWNEVFAKTLISMQDDIQVIMRGFDQIEQQSPNDSISDTPENILTKPHLTFHERQREKLELMKIAQMLHPPNLLTYDVKEPLYPYTDIIGPRNFNLLRLQKNVPAENLFVQHKPFRHRKFRYRSQRALLRVKHDLKKIRRDIYGKRPDYSQTEASSIGVLNYQLRLQKTLLDVRKQIAEYDRVHASMGNHRKSISQIIAETNSKKNSQIEDYRMKSRPMESAYKNSKNELISAPFIPRRTPNNHPIPSKTEVPIDTRFDPTTFLELNKEAEEFFGKDKPFWDKPVRARLSFALPLERELPIHFIFPPKTNIWSRFMFSFKAKQKLMRKQRRRSSGCEYFDCNQQISQSPTTVEF